MTYDFWQQDSQLTRAFVLPQRTTDNHATFQPWQSVDPSQCNNATPIVTPHRTTSGEHATITDYPRDNLSYQHSPPSKHFAPRVAECNIENAANQAPSGASSSYPPYTSAYASAPSLVLSQQHIDSPQMSSIQPFSHYTRHGSRFHEEPCSEHPVDNHRSEVHTFMGSITCQWEDEDGLCNRTIDAKKISDHMSAYHHFKQLPAGPENKLKCKWRECRRLELFRRDTIFRHIREVHLRTPRPKAHTY